jgi:hypothetical protein
LWASAAYSGDTALVIVEAAIDALSYHVIRNPIDTRYVKNTTRSVLDIIGINPK